jgi:hypothetical protein
MNRLVQPALEQATTTLLAQAQDIISVAMRLVLAPLEQSESMSTESMNTPAVEPVLDMITLVAPVPDII